MEVEAADNGEDFHTSWPNSPSLEVKYLSARYSPELPLILNRVSFKAYPGEKIGIVGRTGAGKSSIIQALFRIIEPEPGSVYTLDKFNALEMGLHSLRQHISVIPQSPFFFNGTIRQNIDPFEKASEEEIWEVLKESGLGDHIRGVI